MPYEVRPDPARNLIFVRLAGYLTDEEATSVADEVIAAVARLKPGFGAITDITDFKPGSAKVVAELQRTQDAYVKGGIKRVVRIVGASALAKMQFQRTGEEKGLAMAYVTSLPEAYRVLEE